MSEITEKENAQKASTSQVKEFWDERASNSEGLTLKDHVLREVEIRTLTRFIREGNSVLDVGCGDGYTPHCLSKKIKNLRIHGIDYSEGMISLAKKKYASDFISFSHQDVLRLNLNDKYDVAVSERCLVNLLDPDDQKRAILNIKETLKPGGVFLMMEGSQQGLRRLNEWRQRFRLDPISVSWYNLFFDENKLMPFLSEHFKVQKIVSFGNYMFVSRVIHPFIKKPSYDSNINKIAAVLPASGKSSYLKLFVLERLS